MIRGIHHHGRLWITSQDIGEWEKNAGRCVRVFWLQQHHACGSSIELRPDFVLMVSGCHYGHSFPGCESSRAVERMLEH